MKMGLHANFIVAADEPRRRRIRWAIRWARLHTRRVCSRGDASTLRVSDAYAANSTDVARLNDGVWIRCDRGASRAGSKLQMLIISRAIISCAVCVIPAVVRFFAFRYLITTY
jgi:hypothetical protein